jgi:hypothetical protein
MQKSIINEDLGYHKICVRWVPIQLTDEKSGYMWKLAGNFCSNIMNGRFSCNRLSQVMKTWVHHYEPVSKCRSTGWKHVITQYQEIQNCAFCWKSNVNTILRLSWTHPPGLPGSWTWTVNSAWYCGVLEEMKPTIHSKCRVMLTNGVVLHLNNVQPHTATVASEMI